MSIFNGDRLYELNTLSVQLLAYHCRLWIVHTLTLCFLCFNAGFRKCFSNCIHVHWMRQSFEGDRRQGVSYVCILPGILLF